MNQSTQPYDINETPETYISIIMMKEVYPEGHPVPLSQGQQTHATTGTSPVWVCVGARCAMRVWRVWRVRRRRKKKSAIFV